MGIRFKDITTLATGLLASHKIAYDTGTLTRLLRFDTLADWIIQTYAGFLQSGTGAISRTVQAKLRDHVHIKDFGAVCDGTTDDTTAITNAIAALTSGGTLDYDGTPLISSTITVNKQIKLRGVGAMSDGGANPASYFKKKSTMTTVGISIQASGVIMEGGGVVAAAGSTGGGIVVLQNGVRLHQVTAIGTGVTDATGVGIRVGTDVGTNCNGWVLDACASHSWGSHGVYISDNVSSGLADCNAGTAINCAALTNIGDGFRHQFGLYNKFVGCLGEGNTGRGLHLVDGGNIQIDGGDYEANTAAQVTIAAAASNCTTINLSPRVVVVNNSITTSRLDQFFANNWLAYTAQLKFGGAAVGMTGTFSGRYSRNGNTVTVMFNVTLTAKGSSTGTATIDLPSAYVVGASALSSVSQLHANTLTYASTPLVCYVIASATTIGIGRDSTGAGITLFDDTAFAATTEIYGTLVYEIDKD